MAKPNRARLRSKAAIAALGLLLGSTLALSWVGLEAVVIAHLPDPVSTAPARIYARPPLLFIGLRPDRAATQEHLRRLGYEEADGRGVGAGEYRLGSRLWVIGGRAFRGGGRLEPAITWTVRLGFGGRIGRLEDERRRRYSRVALEPEVIGLGPRRAGSGSVKDRTPVPLSEIPSHLVDAVLTIEDRRFFDHEGLDWQRIAGAAVANLRAGRIVQGGSTITQQLARTLFLDRRPTLLRKVREAAIALTLERRHSKQEILESYLNEVYLGQEGGVAIQGMGRAARHYFAKDVTELDLAEAAFLAAVIRGPSLYSPWRHPERAKGRRDLVLELMRQSGAIDEETRRAATKAPLGVRRERRVPAMGRYFLDFVRRWNDRPDAAREGEEGATVFTSLDGRLQRIAEIALREGLAALEASNPGLAPGGDGSEAGDGPGSEAGDRLQAALVALDPHTGEILAMAGGRDYGISQFNRAARARRQPGSAFKPVVALAALSREGGSASLTAAGGPPITLASVLDDERLLVETPAGPWQPVNYDRDFRGPVTLREALEQSLNVPFARLGLAIGPDRIVETARRLGIESRLAAVPSLALGSGEVTLLELTRAYGVLAAGGYRAELHPVLGVLDADGGGIVANRHSGTQVLGAGEAYLVTSALQGAVDRGTGRGLRASGFQGVVAGKSGTTNGYRDAWFVGYTPSLAVGVWVGFDDGRRIGLPGSGAALPIFARFLSRAVGSDGGTGVHGADDFPYPVGLDVEEVDPVTGLLAGRGCRGHLELFLPGTAPRESCSPWGRPFRIGRGDLRNRARSDPSWVETRASRLRELLELLGEREARVESGRRRQGNRR